MNCYCLIELLCLTPANKVIYIGNSSSDIVGASRIGIKTCWINRQDEEWGYMPKPDYWKCVYIKVLYLNIDP